MPLPQIDAAYLRVAAHLLRRAFGDQPALVKDRDLLRDAEHDLHVVLREEQGQGALLGNAFEEPDRVMRLAR